MLIRAVAAIVAFAGLLAAALFYSQQRGDRLKVSGFIEADEIRVGSRVGGRVRSVPVQEGARVARGDLLVELEPFDLIERRAEAASMLSQRKAQLDKLLAGFRVEEIAQAEARAKQLEAHLAKLRNGPREQELAAAQAELLLAQADLNLAKLKQQRTEGLFGRGAATRDEMDEANSELSAAHSRVQD